jgi:hypothetical protein
MTLLVTSSKTIAPLKGLPRRARSAPTRVFRPRLDPIEDRTLLSTLTVINTDDSGTGSLRAVLASASQGDTIKFSPELDGQTITLTSGPLDIGVGLTIHGPGAGELTVSGGGTQQVFIVPAGVTATIDGLTIADGVAVQGGGIDNFGTLTVNHCTLLKNEAVGGSGTSTTPNAANGGGIANEVGASLSLTQSLLTNNVAAASPGNDSFGGALLNLGSATVTSCTFTGNQATGGGSSSFFDGSVGGAIVSFGFPPSQLYGATLQISNSTFSGNVVNAASGATLATGGAIDLEFGVVATISNSSFTGNVATGGVGSFPQGGGINAEGCTLTLTNSTLTGNQSLGASNVPPPGEVSSAGGGALFLDPFAGTIVNASNCSFTGNLAQAGPGANGLGGAIYDAGGTLTLTNSTLTANQAMGGSSSSAGSTNEALGGGIINNVAGILTMINCTLTSNTALAGSGAPNPSGSLFGSALGGGIYNERGSTLSVTNSALVDNLAQGGINSSGLNGQGLGGGIDNRSSTLSISNSTLVDNQALGAAGGSGVAAGDGFGGGLVDWFNGTATITNTKFAGNLAQGGAGAPGANGGDGIGGGLAVSIGSFLGITADTSSLSLSGSTLTGNVVQGGAGGSGANGGNGWGGGAFVGSGGSASLAGSTITANQALGGLAGSGGSDGQGIGGGLYVDTGASVFLKKTKVKGNVASTSNDNIYGTVISI